MLPTSVVERFSATRGVRFDTSRETARRSVRIPLRLTAILHAVGDDGLIGPPQRVLIKDFSQTGVGLLLSKRESVPDRWVVWWGYSPTTSRRSLVLWCQTARVVHAGPYLWHLGGEIREMLAPEQRLEAGRPRTAWKWWDTAGQTPPDPFAAVPSSSNPHSLTAAPTPHRTGAQTFPPADAPSPIEREAA